MAKFNLKFSGSDSAQNTRNLLSFSNKKMSSFLAAISELKDLKCEVQLLNQNDVSASGSFVITNADIAANDTVKIADVTFTAKASGAVALEFNIGVSATATAANLAQAINTASSSSFASKINATSSGGTTTVTCTQAGSLGNLIAISATVATPGAIVASGTRLSAGQDETASSVNFQNF